MRRPRDIPDSFVPALLVVAVLMATGFALGAAVVLSLWVM